MRRLFVILCISSSVIGSFLVNSDLFSDAPHLLDDDVVFTGKLVRKYYQHLIPQAVEMNIFGWFLELDSASKVYLQEKISALNEEDRQCCTELGFDLSIVQLFLPGVEDKQLCRLFEDEQVEVLGKWPSSPHVFRPIPSYQLHLTEIKQTSGPVVRLTGVLRFKVFPGPPNYDSVEAGDYPEGCWVLQPNDSSKNIFSLPTSLNCDAHDREIAIEVDSQFEGALEHYVNSQVICLGIVHHAETAHHYTSLILRNCKVVVNTTFK